MNLWQRIVQFLKRLVGWQDSASERWYDDPTGASTPEPYNWIPDPPDYTVDEFDPVYDPTWNDPEPDYFPEPVVVKKLRKTKTTKKTKKAKKPSKRVR
jgi:hypothetical protein